MLFHPIIDIPEYDNHLIIQYENGSYQEIFYWAIDYETLLKIFKGERLVGPVIRWCYSKDLDKIDSEVKFLWE